jgi:hypothetical protein
MNPPTANTDRRYTIQKDIGRLALAALLLLLRAKTISSLPFLYSPKPIPRLQRAISFLSPLQWSAFL